jgi:hypothetical protein
VFSLGATLYSLVTGRPPFQAASVIETLDLARTREPAPPRTLVPGHPRDLETIALTGLRKDPRRRYVSAEALADDLERWLDGFPIWARPASKLERAARWCRRRPAFALLWAVLALTAAASPVSLLALWRRSEAQRSRAENALARAIESDKATSATVQELVGLLATKIVSIDSLRKAIAGRLSQRGQPEAGRHVLETNVGMLDPLSEHAGSSPAIALLAALARAEVAPDHSIGPPHASPPLRRRWYAWQESPRMTG